MMIQKAVGGLTFVLLLTLALARAQAATLYVSTQGNDSNPGTSAQPLRTITRAYSLASAGTTILVAPGTYTDYQSGWGLHLGKSGTASSPIVLRSQVRGGAIIDGQNASDGNDAIYIDGDYNVVDGFQIKNGPHEGIAIWSRGNQILNNEIHHNGNPDSSSIYGHDGIYSSEASADNIYVANYIHDNGRTGSNLDHGMYLCGDNELVLNNAVVRNASYGVHIAGYTTVSNMKVYNNVMAFNGKSGIILWQAVSGVDIKNNIVYRNGNYGLDSYDAHGSGVVVDHNLVFGNGLGNYSFSDGGSDYSYSLGTTISSEPLFANSTSLGFDAHLTAGSPAIGAGYNFSSVFTADMDGVTRVNSGAWDLGAYCYGAAADIIAPTISISSPANGVTVFGSAVTISANASDNVGVTGVQFKLDGADLGAEDISAPYSAIWNTTLSANGSHTLSAVARDAAGNRTTTPAISVTVSNSTPASTPTVSITSSDATATEGSSDTASFTLTRTGSTASDLIVTLQSSGSATKWDDYRRPVEGDMPDTWTIPAGASSVTITIAAVDDTLVEGTETATLTIQPATNYNVGTPSSVTITLLDNDSGTIPSNPTVTVVANDANASRVGPDNGAITITRSGSTTSALTVNYSLGGTAVNGTDYTSLGASVTIPVGASSAVITIAPKSSASYVGPKTMTLSLSANAAYTIGSAASATVTIAGNNVPVTSLRKAPANGGMVITWSSQAGKTYHVAYKVNLTDPWVDLSGNITATSPSTSWTDNTAGASRQRFYAVYVTN